MAASGGDGTALLRERAAPEAHNALMEGTRPAQAAAAGQIQELTQMLMALMQNAATAYAITLLEFLIQPKQNRKQAYVQTHLITIAMGQQTVMI